MALPQRMHAETKAHGGKCPWWSPTAIVASQNQHMLGEQTEQCNTSLRYHMQMQMQIQEEIIVVASRCSSYHPALFVCKDKRVPLLRT